MSRSKLESAGYEARRYRKRPNETSNSEVKETMKVSITAKQAVILFMTMALAVVMVACQGAVKPPATVAKEIGDIEFAAGAGASKITLTGYFEVTSPTYTAKSSNTSVATVSVSEAVLTVTPVGAGTANVEVTATGDEGTVSQTFKVTVNAPPPTPANNPPTVRTIPDEALMVGDTETVTLSRYADDSEGDALTYSAASSNDAVATASVAGDVLTITAVAEGTATITVTVSDGTNSPVNREFDVEVTATPPVEPPGPPNERPEQTLIDDIDDMRREGTRELDLSDYYDDPDGDTLTYTATSSDEMVATVSVSGSMLTITGVGVGTARITVIAMDGTDEVRQTFTVTVGSQAPVVDASLPTSFPLGLAGATKVLNLSKYYDDPEGDALTFAADSSDDTVATVTDPDAMSMIMITAVGPGSATITVTASDSDNDPVSLGFFVTVSEPDVDNMGPVVRASMVEDKNLHVGGTETLTLSMYFMDPDAGDTLEYGADSSDDAVATVTDPDAASMITITAVSVGGATITITATDSHGESATATFEVTVTPVPNTPPALTPGMTAPTVTLEDSASWMRDVSGYFMDADGDTLTYSADSSDNTKARASVSGSTVTITAVAAGPATITVTATDGEDSVALMIAVTVNPPPNNPPTLTPGRSVPDVTLVLEDDPSWARDVSGYFMDADGDALTYSADSSDNTKARTSVSGSTVTITAVAEGSATITVTASDDEDSAAMSIYVTVAPAPVTPTPNAAPSIKKAIGDRKVELIADGQTNAGMEISINLSEHFEDPEMGPLYYSVSIVSQSPTATTTPAPKVIDLVAGYPDGTDLNSSLVIDAMNTGTAMVKVVARDAQLAATESMFMITVIEVDGNSTPELVAAADPAGVIADVDGDPASTRLKVGDTKKVIDNRKISEYFTDNDFPSVTLDARGDTLTFEVKSYANGTAVADLVTNGDLQDVTPLAADKAQVSTSLSKTTWNGDDSTFTLSLTGERGSTAETVATDVVAIIATDEFGKSAVSIFEVRVNHEPQPYGAQAAEDDRTTLGEYEGFMNLSAAAAATTLDLVAASAGYFSDMDGDTMTCAFLTSEHNVADDDKTAIVTINANTLSVDPQNIGTMYVDVWCNDGLEDSDSARLMVEVDRGASIAPF